MNFRLSSRFSAWPLSTTGYGVLIEPVLGQRCAHSGDVYDWSWSARRVLGWVLNLKDLAIEGVFSHVLLWGILVNLSPAPRTAHTT
jgi:hypothetical protein